MKIPPSEFSPVSRRIIQKLLEKQIPGAPAWFTGALAAQLTVQSKVLVTWIIDEVLDAVRVDLDRRRDFAQQAFAARVEMHA